jgi:predicted Rossmann fold nucleotide-binding protein DprA/Smf involved in DNA uptake
MSYEDILMSYYSRYPQYMQQPEPALRDSERLVFAEHPQEQMPQHIAETVPEMPVPEPVKPAPPASGKDDKPLPESEAGRAIVQYLRECGDTYADDIAAALDMDLSTLLSELTLLELDGFVETLFGKHYRAC